MTAHIAAEDAERVAGLKACEHGLCASPGVRRVEVLRDGWRVPESRVYCEEHAREASSAVPAPRPRAKLDQPAAPRPLRAEVLRALTSEPRHFGVIRDALTRPANPFAVRRELDQLIAEGLAVEGPKTRHPYTTLTHTGRVIEDVRAHPWSSVGDIMRRTEDAAASARLVQAVQDGRLVRIGAPRSYRYAVAGTPIPGAEGEAYQPACSGGR